MLTSGDQSRASEARSVIRDISQVSSVLRDEVTLIEPTAIDELRLSFLPRSKSNELHLIWSSPELPPALPILSERWQLPDEVENLGFDPPSEATDPNAFDADIDKATLSEDQIRYFAQLMRPLVVAIREQINARDHKLVEQSGRLVVYRPLYQGPLAQGVGEESVTSLS